MHEELQDTGKQKNIGSGSDTTQTSEELSHISSNGLSTLSDEENV